MAVALNCLSSDGRQSAVMVASAIAVPQLGALARSPKSEPGVHRLRAAPAQRTMWARA
jgi:hypothetical protein